MAKKGKKPAGKGTPARERAAPPVNPFEVIHAKKRFSFLGTRDRGAAKSSARKRSDAQEERRRTLLVEYRQLRRANVFADRRLGEADAGLSDADRAIARFQRQRLREHRRSKFNLSDAPESEDVLTHGGVALDALDDFAEDVRGSDDDDDGDGGGADADALSFGGGLFTKTAEGNGDGGEGAERPRTHKEIMAEVIAKSKEHKREKRRQREADADALAGLDAAFEAVVREGLLQGRPKKGEGAGVGEGGAAVGEDDAAYDRLQRALVFEARGVAGERSKTEAELEEESRRRAEAAASAVARRMAGSGDADVGGDFEDIDTATGDGDGTGVAAQGGGYAGRRARLRALQAAADAEGSSSGEENEDGEEGEDGGDALARARLARNAPQHVTELTVAGMTPRAVGKGAAGLQSHPLRAAFQEQLKALAEKRGAAGGLGGKTVREVLAELGMGAEELVGEGSGSEGEGESGSGGESERDEDGESGSEGEDGSEGEGGSEGEEGSEGEGGSGEEEGSDGDGDEGGGVGGGVVRRRVLHLSDIKALMAKRGEERARRGKRGTAVGAAVGVGDGDGEGGGEGESGSDGQGGSDEEGGSDGEGEGESGSESEESGGGEGEGAGAGAVAVDGRGKGNTADGVGAAASVADNVPGSVEELAERLAGAEAGQAGLVVAEIAERHRAELLSDSGRGLSTLYALAWQCFVDRASEGDWRRVDALTPTLVAMTAQIPVYAATLCRARLSRIHRRVTEGQWPMARDAAAMRLMAAAFPVTDKRHPVLTPLSLLLSHSLTVGPIATPTDIAQGLYLASLLAHLHAAAGRLVPECVTFACVAMKEAARMAGEGTGAVGGGAAGSAKKAKGAVRAEQVGSVKGNGKEFESASALEWPCRLRLADAWGGEGGGSEGVGDGRAGLATACVGGAGALAERLLDTHAGLPCAAEVAGAVGAAAGRAAVAVGVGAMRSALQGLAARAKAAVRAAEVKRAPLAQPFRLVREGRRALNPRFEEEFAMGKSYDPDRERAESRSLRRAVSKEQRGVMRSLRKDAAFMHAVRERERAARDVERVAGQRRALAALEQQEADARSGGQGGWGKKRKRGGKG